ncbi:MAG: hypothetical protein PHU68_11760 [Paludibacter sp.]|jgi:hypothetical protein|nr:hypothetical protein [Paludibacter sp.]
MFNKHFLFVVVMVVCSGWILAQNNTNSPYTRFGYGELIENYTAEQRAMGGIAIAGRNPLSINTVNPASYTSVDSLTFMFDVGLSGLISQFQDPQGVNKKFTSNLEYISLQFPFTRWMAFSAGMLPYSFSGYSFYRSDSIAVYHPDQTDRYAKYTQSFSGNGGVSQVYAGLSFNLFNQLALGVNAYYMFGEVNNRRSNVFTTTGYESSTQDNSIVVSNYRFRYGLQYYRVFAKKHDVKVGFIFENKAPLGGESMQINTGVPTDTINFTNNFDLPMTFGGGINYTFNEKITIGIDYVTQQWADARFYNKTDSLANHSKLSIGAEYIPDIRGRNYSDRIRYRAGFTTSEPYYKVAGNVQPRNFGISFGVGLPLRTSNTLINASVEYGKVGERSLFREDYFKFTLNATFSENWFFKRKL